MKSLSVQQKLFLIPAIIVAAVFLLWGFYSAGEQASQAEQGFREQLATLAHTSTAMTHSAAEEYAVEKGWTFHRFLGGQAAGISALEQAEAQSFKTFSADVKRNMLDVKIAADSSELLAVFVPARIQSSCSSCHNESGIDIFSDKKEGDLVAVFGVSGSLNGVAAQKAKIRWITLLIGIASVGAVVSVIRFIVRRIVVLPVLEIAMQSERVSSGDLSFVQTPMLEKKIHSGDEIGVLARAYQTMLNSLRTLIKQVQESSEKVTVATYEISGAAEQMAAGAQEQTSQTEEIAGAINEMAKNISENSQNALSSAEIAKKAKSVAESGGTAVNNTITGMKRIAEVVHESTATVQTLGASSDQIGEIISVIDDIADQTNLLALNAAIEAARAGEHGRGFAVVADEVRKLAERTTKATKEISTMITTIQNDTCNAVHSMSSGTKEVENGIFLAEKAGDALTEIVDVSQKTTEMVVTIASSSEEQASTADHIAKNIEAISTVAHQSAGTIQQIAGAAEQLNRLTDGLKAVVNRFTFEQKTDKKITQSNERQLSTTKEKIDGLKNGKRKVAVLN
ncbi:MAG: methyl-accepting chemotaxis protein [Bacteroidetes bacterium]|nr:methyl-accepting chemotaxis protein [Bacteroidota bacterium]